MASIGPTLPPEFTAKRKRSEETDRDDSAPPAKRSQNNSPNPSAPIAPSRTIGPALPPGLLSEHPETSPSPPPPRAHAPPQKPSKDDDDSDSDSDFGPAPPPADGTTATVSSFTPPPLSPPPDQALKREDWMLAPPPSSGNHINPLKPPRKFASKSSSSGPSRTGELDSLWTETPEQKRQRLADEVVGKRAKGTDPEAVSKDEEEKRRRQEKVRREMEGKVREYNERNQRGGSLYKEHEKRRTEHKEGRKGAGSGEKEQEEEDDPSKRVFDREKDMGLGVKIGHKARADMTREAKGFGGRFGAGGYL